MSIKQVCKHKKVPKGTLIVCSPTKLHKDVQYLFQHHYTICIRGFLWCFGVALNNVCVCIANKKESNNLESIQLPNTFRRRHQRERRTHLKQRHQNTTSSSQKDNFFSKKIGQTAIQNKNFTRTYMQRRTTIEVINHSRSTGLERSVKIFLRGGLKSILRGHNPRP